MIDIQTIDDLLKGLQIIDMLRQREARFKPLLQRLERELYEFVDQIADEEEERRREIEGLPPLARVQDEAEAAAEAQAEAEAEAKAQTQTKAELEEEVVEEEQISGTNTPPIKPGKIVMKPAATPGSVRRQI